ncbi:MAG: hypothetical protein ACI9ZV_000228 [Candidatus Azotimanducaceae bacterium]|jgi:hypothetical protein
MKLLLHKTQLLQRASVVRFGLEFGIYAAASRLLAGTAQTP